jgi:hypothetical protein
MAQAARSAPAARMGSAAPARAVSLAVRMGWGGLTGRVGLVSSAARMGWGGLTGRGGLVSSAVQKGWAGRRGRGGQTKSAGLTMPRRSVFPGGQKALGGRAARRIRMR